MATDGGITQQEGPTAHTALDVSPQYCVVTNPNASVGYPTKKSAPDASVGCPVKSSLGYPAKIDPATPAAYLPITGDDSNIDFPLTAVPPEHVGYILKNALLRTPHSPVAGDVTTNAPPTGSHDAPPTCDVFCYDVRKYFQ